MASPTSNRYLHLGFTRLLASTCFDFHGDKTLIIVLIFGACKCQHFSSIEFLFVRIPDITTLNRLWRSTSDRIHLHDDEVSLWWEPGMNQRQPLLIVASSKAIHTPIIFSGSLKRNVPSWWGMTAKHNVMRSSDQLVQWQSIVLTFRSDQRLFEDVHWLTDCWLDKMQVTANGLCNRNEKRGWENVLFDEGSFYLDFIGEGDFSKLRFQGM